MGKISALEVLRLRAIKPSVWDRSAKRFAQDDVFVGVLKKNIVSKLALMGRSPFERFCYVGKNTAAKNKNRCA
jgi:hypothetical protein